MRMMSAARLKLSVRILVLGAFVAFLAIGLLGLWAVAFMLGLIVEAIKPGRLYCTWLCPVRAAHGFAGIGSAASKKGTPLLGSRAIKAIGRVFIAAFLVLFGISIAIGLRGWLFPSFVAIGIIISSQLSLHRFCSNMCPFGSAFVIIRRCSVKTTSFCTMAFLKRPPDEAGALPGESRNVSAALDGDCTPQA